MDDNIYINPIDNTAEVTPAANRLYNQGVEKIKRREENHQMKKYKEQRAEIMELEEKPILCPKTKDIIFKKNIKVPIKEFFEYNMEWKKGVDQRTEKERKEKEKLRHLETELELAKIKEAQERYSRNKSKSQPKLPETSKPRPQRVHELVKHVVIQPPEDPPSKGKSLTHSLQTGD